MTPTILIYGESGTGKSTALRTLNPEETFIISTLGNPLPFKGWRNLYKIKTKENNGNMIVSCDPNIIIRALLGIKDEMKHIKNIIIDDFQYIMSNEFMERASEKSYEKFTEIGKNVWSVIMQAKHLRDDIKVFILTHSDTDPSTRKTKIKTIGRLLEEKVCIEGMFTISLYSTIIDEKYCFVTQNTGDVIAKSPCGMFETKVIDNDLQFIINKIDEYEKENKEDINQ